MTPPCAEATESVLVTGSRKGLGRAMAEHFLSQGKRVYGCSRSASDLSHPNYHHTCMDVADEAAVCTLLRQIAKGSAPLKAVINNAGIASMNALLLTPAKTASAILSTNVSGSFLVLRESAKVFLRQKTPGRIVNFSSVAVALDLEGEALYAASKAAVESLTAIAARELGSYGVTVNAIAPTPIDTDLIRTVPQHKREELIGRQAIRRLGTVADVLNVVDFFLSPASDFITGQTLYLGGIRG